MKALVCDRLGSPDFLEIRDVARPFPAKNEVLVRVHAVSINDWDLACLDDHFANRLRRLFTRTTILGCDIGGRVESSGPGATRFKPGDAVHGDLSRYFGGFGGFAEYVRAPETSLALKPDAMSFEQAAAIPHAGVLAVQALLARGRLRSGQKVLINGAGGGVGTFAIQLARLPGFHDVEVTGVDSAGKLDMLRLLGFDHVVDYRQEDFTNGRKCYDLIVDTKTSRSPDDYSRALTPGGTYVSVGGSARLAQLGLAAPLIRRRTGKNLFLVRLKPNKDLAYLNELFEAGQLVPVIDGPYKFREAREAFRHFEAANHKGKVVITMD